MTTPTDSDITDEDIEATPDTPTPPPVAKFSKFGNA
jgi:hypothetical protein